MKRRPASFDGHESCFSFFVKSFCGVCLLLLILFSVVALAFYRFPTGSYFGCNANLGRKLMLLLSPRAPSDSLPTKDPIPIWKPKALAFVGIMSSHGYGGRRDAIRNTWLPKKTESSNGNGLIFKFIIGKSENQGEEESIQSEMKAHGDILRLDHVESYGVLNRKSFAYFKLAFSLYDADYYVKMDDDIYVIPVRLTSFLMKKRESPNVYWGCMVKGRVEKNPHLRWYEPNHPLLPNEYPLHSVGSFYGLSKPVAEALVHDPSIERRMIFSEDVMIGFWMVLWSVEFENDLNLCSHTCSKEAIAVWYPRGPCNGLCNPEWSMSSLHGNSECRPVT